MIIRKKVVTLCNYCVFSFSETVPVNLSTASSIIYIWCSVSRRRLSLQLGAGIIRAFCGLFQFDRQVNTAQCLPAIQPALLRWRRRQNAEHCEKNYTYTCNQSACGAKQYQESYFMFALQLEHLLQSRLLWVFLNLSGWSKLRFRIYPNQIIAWKTQTYYWPSLSPRKSVTRPTHHYHKQCWMCSYIK